MKTLISFKQDKQIYHIFYNYNKTANNNLYQLSRTHVKGIDNNCSTMTQTTSTYILKLGNVIPYGKSSAALATPGGTVTMLVIVYVCYI